MSGSLGAQDLQSTATALLYGNVSEWFVTGGDTAQLVQPPWVTPSNPSPYGVGFLTLDESVLMYAGAGLNSTGAAPEVWRTTDGVAWENIGPATGWRFPDPSSRSNSTQLFALPGIEPMAALYHLVQGNQAAELTYMGGRGDGLTSNLVTMTRAYAEGRNITWMIEVT